MKRLLALAAFLLASSAAEAQYSFQYGSHTIHVDPDRGIVSIPGVYDNSGRKPKHTRNSDHNTAHNQQQVPQQAKVEPQAPSAPPDEAGAAPASQALAPAAQPPAAPSALGATATNPPAPSATATVTNAPVDAAVLPPAPPPSATPAEDAPPKPAPPPAVAAVPPEAASAPLPARAAVRDPSSPVGMWLTEEKEGKIRIEQCGSNLCGYSVDAKSNQNGEQILINMKPVSNMKWSGRIVDPNTGSTYDLTIALRGPDTLRVQGCAFGGMFCGSQTWTRVD